MKSDLAGKDVSELKVTDLTREGLDEYSLDALLRSTYSTAPRFLHRTEYTTRVPFSANPFCSLSLLSVGWVWRGSAR